MNRKNEFEEVLQSINYNDKSTVHEAITEQIFDDDYSVSFDSNMESTQILDRSNKFFDIGFSKNIGCRKSQQDSIAVSADSYERPSTEKRVLAVLSDGMGGLNGGEKASKLCTDKMLAYYQNEEKIDDYPQFFRDCLVDIDAQVKSLKDEKGDPLGCGATIVTFAIDKDELYWATVGDSHLYIIRGDEIVQVNQDHNYMMRLMKKVKSGEISLEEAKKNKKKDALISFMGIGFLELIDINKKPFKIMKNDLVLACSDGLYRTLSESEILSTVKSYGGDMQLLSHILISNALAKQRKNQDNISVIIIKNI